ncbi:MAG: hypothetical protein ABJK11_03815 [Balneola sp.]
MSTFQLRKTRDFGQIITDTFTYLRVHFKSLGKALFIFVFPILLISGVLISSSFMSIFDLADPNFSQSANPEFTGEMASFFVKFFIGMLLFMVNFLLIYVVVFKHMQLVDEGVEQIEVGMLLEDFARNFFGTLGLFFVLAIATMIGLIFLIIPGIYIATKLSLAPVIFIAEEESFGDALSKSWKATQDYWWFTFGMSFVMGIIMNFASYIFIIPMYILIGIVSFSTASAQGDPSSLGTIISVLYGLSVVVPALLYCMPVISQALVYFNIQERKTGNSMMNRIESLGEQNNPS